MKPEAIRYDTIVVGAGPAGSTAGFLLAKAGLRVLIVDKKSFPRPKLCGGLITWKTIRLIEKIFGSDTATLKTKGIIVHKSDRYAVCDTNQRTYAGKMDDPFHFVDRIRYDQLWLEQAMNAGAELSAPATVSAIDVGNSTVSTREGAHYHGKFILGADGALSRVKAVLRRQRCINEPARRGLARAIEVKLTRAQAAELPEHPRIYYGHIPWGYAWSFPGPGYQLVGIAGLDRRTSGNILEAFHRFTASLSICLPVKAKLKAAALPYGNFLKSPGWRNILLIGDAGGLVDPLLGEGIFHAHRSAQLAARSILSAGENQSDVLKDYSSALTRQMIPDLRYARAGRNLVYSLPRKWYYPVLTGFLRIIRKACVETIQGRRTFLWFRKVNWLD